MKSILIATILLAAAMLPAQRIKGSDTMLSLSKEEANSFAKANPSATITVSGGGSGVGISALIEGNADIAQSSRKIKDDEIKKLKDMGYKINEIIIAYDALAVVVNPKNSVDNLTKEQMEGIFTGRITNWKEVGGADLKITAYSRETSSGTYEFFKEEILMNKDYVSGIVGLPTTAAVINSISQTPGGISYVGLAHVNSNVKAIRVSYDAGKTFVEPSVKAAKNGTYPIVRPLIYYYADKSEDIAKPFIDYVLSASGQKIVGDIGFIPVR